MKRLVEPELIDDPATSKDRLEYLLRCVRLTNSRLGGTAVLLDCLKAWCHRWPRNRPVTLLDIGTGSADLPLAAADWARSAGFRMHITGIDANPRILDVARRLSAGRKDIELHLCDAMNLLNRGTSPFADASFDYVHAGMFIHHLDDATVPRMLAAMNRLARNGVVWNDLIRSHRGYAVAWLATIGRAIRHDCLASLRAGFREREVLELAAQTGLEYASYRERYNYQRFSLAGEKPGAWSTTDADTTILTVIPNRVAAPA
jgi:ubiquinone/menaquinone biosynthesis C-methylase UbiE